MLSVAALIAFSLAALGIVLAAAAAARDEERELFDLQAHGADPRLLRRQLRLRVVLFALCGLVGGIATGVMLSEIVVAVVAVTAGATTPDPPLVLVVDWLRLGLEAGIAAAVAAALVALVTRTPGHQGSLMRLRWLG